MYWKGCQLQVNKLGTAFLRNLPTDKRIFEWKIKFLVGLHSKTNELMYMNQYHSFKRKGSKGKPSMNKTSYAAICTTCSCCSGKCSMIRSLCVLNLFQNHQLIDLIGLRQTIDASDALEVLSWNVTTAKDDITQCFIFSKLSPTHERPSSSCTTDSKSSLSVSSSGRKNKVQILETAIIKFYLHTQCLSLNFPTIRGKCI